MEIRSLPGNLSCIEVREMLSDLIDVRDCEVPHPEGTRLAEAGMRASVELHLAACPECQDDLNSMSEVGAAFAEFDVGEPPAQHFANYAELVRAQMKRRSSPQFGAAQSSAPLFGRRRRLIWGALAAGLAAAVALYFLSAPARVLLLKPGPTLAANQLRPRPSASTPIRVKIPNGLFQTVSREFVHNPTGPDAALDEYQKDEGRLGYLVFGEAIRGGQSPLLGVELKTTRDVDRVKDEGPGGLMVYNVLPGSPAEKMGLQKNDYIVTVNETAVNDGGSVDAVNFLTAIHQLGAGEPITLHVVRPEGKEYVFMRPLEGVLGGE